MSLTPKQQRFCEEYIIDLNGAQAAIRAGYSEDSARAIASENLTKPDIQEKLQELMAARSIRTKITADYVLGTIYETIERCKQEVPVRDKEGNETGEYVFKENGVLKGTELLGKHLKLFTDVSDVNTNHTFNKMGRIKAETHDGKTDGGEVKVKSVTLSFDIGEPVPGMEDEQ